MSIKQEKETELFAPWPVVVVHRRNPFLHFHRPHSGPMFPSFNCKKIGALFFAVQFLRILYEQT
jgi:hypothetical protein